MFFYSHFYQFAKNFPLVYTEQEREDSTLAFVTIFIALILSIILHEFGHYLAARHYGIIATEFNLGMGPKLFGFSKSGTDWNFRLFLIGGSCVYGDVNDKALEELPAAKRISVFLAGPFMNFVLCVVCYTVWKVSDGTATLLTPIESIVQVVQLVPSVIGSLVTILNPGRATLYETGSLIEYGFHGVGIFQALGFGFAIGYAMNAGLFIFNILPIPALDGGQTVLTLPELFGHPLSPKVKNALNGSFLFILMGISIIYLIQDCLLSTFLFFI